MAPLAGEELESAKSFGVKAVIVAAVAIPPQLIFLHFIASAMKIDFNPVKETEIIITCLAVLGLVAKWAFSKTKS